MNYCYSKQALNKNYVIFRRNVDMKLFNSILLITIIASIISCDIIASPIPYDLKDDDVVNNSLAAGEINETQIETADRGTVQMEVYLPPDWDTEFEEGYPLIFYLHGQNGNDHSFFSNVNYKQLNDYINEEEITPFVLVSVASYQIKGIQQQWSTSPNEKLFASEDDNSLRAFCKKHFNAGILPGTVSIHGQSMGARGALHYGFKYPHLFASAVANAFVSDYALQEEQLNAEENKEKIIENGTKIRIVIGTNDYFYIRFGRVASFVMNEFLTSLEIPHEFEVIPGAKHFLDSIWNSTNESGIKNGLYELKFHASAWENQESKIYIEPL